MATGPTPSTGDRASALAEHLGMTREAVEELLQKTHSEYANAATLPAEPHRESRIEQAAQHLPPTAEEQVPPNLVRKTSKPLSGGFIAAIFIVLLLGLGIAASFRQGCFSRRGEVAKGSPPDTIASMMKHADEEASTPPQAPSAVEPGQVPPEALAIPQEEPSGITTHSLRAEPSMHHKLALTTTSNFEAEEELAKLHAQGKTRAYMRAARKRNSVIYRVFANP